EKEPRDPEPQDKHRAESGVEHEGEDEIDLNSIRIEPESTQVVSSSFAAFDEARKTRAEEAYPIVHIEENPKKGTSMVLVGIVAGMFIASLAMMVMSWVMFGAKEPSAPVSASGVPIDFEAHREEDLRELQAIERERDTALAVSRALKLERDAAVNVVAAREKIRKAELRAAEILAEQAEQGRKIEKKLMAAKIRAQEAERAEARALDRERELRIKAQKKSKEIEARQARRKKERSQALAAQVREEQRLRQERKAAKAASDAQIVRAREQQAAQDAIARQAAEAKAKAAQAESKRFSSNPCNSPSAKFLSTCKK
ncbi:hypothetical protein MNBD_GAMMA10-1299, partial [hydrothermal vent metagenome]